MHKNTRDGVKVGLSLLITRQHNHINLTDQTASWTVLLCVYKITHFKLELSANYLRSHN